MCIRDSHRDVEEVDFFLEELSDRLLIGGIHDLSLIHISEPTRQAVNLASENNSLWTVAVLKPKFLDESFEFIPRRQARIWITAFGFRGSGAKQQMVADPLNAHAASAANGTRVVPRFTCSRTAMRAH